MDKRWIGILLILIAGLGCMYIIVSTSTSVGNAVSVISDVTVTLPSGFVTTEDGSDYCVLHNKQTNETIRINCLDDMNRDSEYKNTLKTLKQQGNIKINEDSSNNTLSVIKYENLSSKDNKNIELVYFDKCNHTFKLQLEHFNNDESKNNAVNFIIDTIQYDFKQNKG